MHLYLISHKPLLEIKHVKEPLVIFFIEVFAIARLEQRHNNSVHNESKKMKKS